MGCEGQAEGQGASGGNPGHLHNDVTVRGSSNDVISTQRCTANSDAVTNSNGM